MGLSANEFAAPRADVTASFKEIGDKVIGTVIYIGDWYEHTNNFGNTVTQCKLVLEVDGTPTNLYVERGRPMAEAIASAVRRAGQAELVEGGTLGVSFSSTKPTTKGNPLKLYSATYEPGTAPVAASAQADEEDPF